MKAVPLNMESRRSFLAAALAWLASLVALVWPRRALSLPSRARGPFTRPTAPADPAPAEWRCGNCDDGGVKARDFDDIRTLLDEMHDHLCKTGHDVLSADEPCMRMVGFSTFGPDPADSSRELSIWWRIPVTRMKVIVDVPRSFATPGDPEAVGIFREHLMDSKSRCRLAYAYYKDSQDRFKAGLGPLPRD
jgi:hypothetical protein